MLLKSSEIPEEFVTCWSKVVKLLRKYLHFSEKGGLASVWGIPSAGKAATPQGPFHGIPSASATRAFGISPVLFPQELFYCFVKISGTMLINMYTPATARQGLRNRGNRGRSKLLEPPQGSSTPANARQCRNVNIS